MELNLVTTATETKTSLENKHLRIGDYFAVVASFILLLTDNAANELVEAPLK